MKLYEINEDYLEYLHKIDSRVLTHNIKKHQRKFIAIKIKLNGYQYFVPLSSPDSKDYYIDDQGIKRVQFTRVPTIKRIFNGNPTVESYLGKLLFNNMIPVSQGYYHEFNIFLEKDQKYKGLLINQIRVLRSRKNQEDILKRAQVVYKLKKGNSTYNFIKHATVDFTVLEKKCEEYSIKDVNDRFKNV